MCLNTRFQADHTIVGNIEQACRELTSRVEVLTAKVNKKRAIKAALSEEEQCERVGGALDKFSYMMHNNPDAVEVEVSAHGNGSHHKRMSLCSIERKGIDSILKESENLWDTLHTGDVSMCAMSTYVRYDCYLFSLKRPFLLFTEYSGARLLTCTTLHDTTSSKTHRL
jgi:hypothetical protein